MERAEIEEWADNRHNATPWPARRNLCIQSATAQIRQLKSQKQRAKANYERECKYINQWIANLTKSLWQLRAATEGEDS